MSDLRITDIKTYIVPTVPASEVTYNWSGTKQFLLVKIETNRGISGWGECYTLADRERSTVTHIEEMKAYLVGSDPCMISRFRNWGYNLFGERRPGIDLFCAFSGIEIAMYDILGKSLGVPVYDLLGGPVHKKLPAYANLGPDGVKTPDEEVSMARELAARYGYSAFKLYPFANDETEDEMIARIAHFREGLGPDYRIMIDVWRTTDARLALSVARAIEKYNICWYEEPIGPDDLNVLRDIKMKTDLPLVAGEAMYGKRWFNEVCKLNCVDYINPDVSVVGGIAEMCDIAAIAEANYIKVGPHNCNSSTVSLNATIHAACTMPNLSSVETFPWHEEIGDKMSFNQIKVKDGYLELPDGPGLGIHMNEEFLKSLEYSPRPPKTWKLFEEKI